MYLKNWDEFKFKTNMFWKLIQFSFKQGGLYQAPSIWVHGRGLRPLQRPVRMPAARLAERVNDEPVKVICSLLPLSFENEQKISKICAFTEPIQPGNTLKNWYLRKTEKATSTLNGCISKASANSKSKLTFSESSFNFLWNSEVFCTFYLRGYTGVGSTPEHPQWRCQQLAALRELMMSQ